MASRLEFVRYVCKQLAGAGAIRCKRMFGEYGLWCNGRFFATIERDMLCLKITQAGREMLPGAEIVEPHVGARFLYVERLDDPAFLAELVQRTCAALPAPILHSKRRADNGEQVSANDIE
nr:TfoX/Sxy family protein [uncultured Agathobaculum sp.]